MTKEIIYTKIYTKNYMKKYYLNNRQKLIDYNILRYNKLVSGRLNLTEFNFIRGIFKISFN